VRRSVESRRWAIYHQATTTALVRTVFLGGEVLDSDFLMDLADENNLQVFFLASSDYMFLSTLFVAKRCTTVPSVRFCLVEGYWIPIS
ncbi:hypothetical protein SLA2020_249080, partial [Shorea laevis]